MNGKVILSGSTLGCVARYTCNLGYNVIGDVKRECLQNSTWSGSNSTMCQGLYVMTQQSIVTKLRIM